MWPSLPVANHIADVANIFFIGSLVVGVAATVLIVWMSGVKEAYWEKDRTESAERVASLIVQGDQLRKDTAEANARALESQLALEKFKAPRTLTPEQLNRVSERLKPFTAVRFDTSIIPGDPEAMGFLVQIASALEKGGWVWVEWNHPTGPLMNVYQLAGKPNIGQGGVSVGLRVAVHKDHEAEFIVAATELALSLGAEGAAIMIDAAAGDEIPNHDTIHIVIGKKP
jgi:hypothetical protein